MASAINPITSGATPPSASGGISGAANEEVFLQLLVSQLQNQDPLNPADSTQFVAELAQFSALEQLIGIRHDIETPAATTPAGDTSGSATPPPSSTDGSGTQPTKTNPIS